MLEDYKECSLKCKPTGTDVLQNVSNGLCSTSTLLCASAACIRGIENIQFFLVIKALLAANVALRVNYAYTNILFT